MILVFFPEKATRFLRLFGQVDGAMFEFELKTSLRENKPSILDASGLFAKAALSDRLQNVLRLVVRRTYVIVNQIIQSRAFSAHFESRVPHHRQNPITLTHDVTFVINFQFSLDLR